MICRSGSRYGEVNVSDESKKLREGAASEVRKSRKSNNENIKRDHQKRAAALKSLASEEEWLSGEKQKSEKPSKK